MTHITIVQEGKPNEPLHIPLLSGKDTESVNSESVDITSEQIQQNIENSAVILSTLSGVNL